jgi:hypothetical protein
MLGAYRSTNVYSYPVSERLSLRGAVCWQMAALCFLVGRRRSSEVAVQQGLHHGSTELALEAEAAYCAGTAPGLRRQRLCMTAIPKLLCSEDVSCKK